MRQRLGAWVTAAVLIGAYAYGQEATEMYIPVGQSPGLSGKSTVIGRIEAADARTRTLTVSGTSRSWTGTLTDQTKIWLDRSRLREKSLPGTFADLKTGWTAEVKYGRRDERGEVAEWIKVQATERDGGR